MPTNALDHFNVTVIAFGVQFTISPNDRHNCLPRYVIKPLQLIPNAAAPLLNLPKYFHITPLLLSLQCIPIPAKIKIKASKDNQWCSTFSYSIHTDARLPWYLHSHAVKSDF